ncbi:MAG: phosphate signaling complex protein PhoU [Endomicrobium sp.]|jgi:phosphate transport system protein|nr:phosphate signaling complex protein PhoU [Endomicrobium sp.]
MRHFDVEINDLQDHLLKTAELVQNMIRAVMQELINKDIKQSEVILCLEKKVNIQEIVIDDKCLKLIALNQPVGADLRFITSAMRISSDLERMGDETVNIGKKIVHLIKNADLKPLVNVPKMVKIVQNMIVDCIKAFNTNNSDLALSVLMKDDEVDDLKSKIFNDIKKLMVEASDIDTVQKTIDLMFVAKSIERLGDHITNISEDVIFMIHGKNIRHPRVYK